MLHVYVRKHKNRNQVRTGGLLQSENQVEFPSKLLMSYYGFTIQRSLCTFADASSFWVAQGQECMGGGETGHRFSKFRFFLKVGTFL